MAKLESHVWGTKHPVHSLGLGAAANVAFMLSFLRFLSGFARGHALEIGKQKEIHITVIRNNSEQA